MTLRFILSYMFWSAVIGLFCGWLLDSWTHRNRMRDREKLLDDHLDNMRRAYGHVEDWQDRK